MGGQEASEPASTDDLERDVDVVIACGGSQRAAIRALLIVSEFLSAELERARERQSVGSIAMAHYPSAPYEPRHEGELS